MKNFTPQNLEHAILQPDLKNLKDTVNAALLKLSKSIENFGLNDQMNYAVLSYGKRLRPLMTLLSNSSVGGNTDDSINVALALELMHTATLVHDDVLDNDKTRRGLTTVHNKWSIGEALLAGDALFALSLKLIANYDEEIIKVFSETAMILAEGEYLDFMSFKTDSEQECLERIEKKSASLFRAATKCGALIGKGSSLEVSSLESFGQNFGMAYQIRDDLLDIVEVENEIPSDLKQRRITLPIIHLLNSLDEKDRNQLNNKLAIVANENNPLKVDCFKDILNLLNEKRSIEYCNDKIKSYIDLALEAIEPVKENASKKHLVEMAKSLLLTT